MSSQPSLKVFYEDDTFNDDELPDGAASTPSITRAIGAVAALHPSLAFSAGCNAVKLQTAATEGCNSKQNS